jgi:hypothetical protein
MDKKAALLASALALAASAAPAQMTFTPTGDVVFAERFDPGGGVFEAGAYAGGQSGGFMLTGQGHFTLTYLGEESVFGNGVTIAANGATLDERSAIGDWITSTQLGAGVAPDFRFWGSDGQAAANGGAGAGRSSFVLLGTNVQTARGSFQYLVGYNDGAQHDDWDDFVIGINAVPAPEPQTYALLLAGLGMMSFIARRRHALNR